MGLPHGRDLAGVRAAVVGLPFDCGLHPVRIGARLGPSAIREQSVLVRAYEPPYQDFDDGAELRAVDCGDVRLQPRAILESQRAIEEAVEATVASGAAPICLGGDGAVSLPQMRALHLHHPDLAVLHIDAHTDTFPGEGAERARYNTATTFTRAAEEGIVQVASSFHLGPRGATFLPRAWSYAEALGYRVIPDHLARARGMADVVAEILAELAGRPVFLCFDMDYF